MKEDNELVQEALQGEVLAFEELMRKYESGIMNFCWNMVTNKTAAEDLTQEVFINVYNKLYTFRKENKFSTWLYQVAKNKCIDYLRREKKRQTVNIDLLTIESKDASPEFITEFKETRNTIRCFLDTLSDIDRQIIILRYVKDNFTFSEIAQIMNLSEASVKKRYYRAYDKYEQFIESQKEKTLKAAYRG